MLFTCQVLSNIVQFRFVCCRNHHAEKSLSYVFANSVMGLDAVSWQLTITKDPPSFSIAINCSTSSSPKLWRGSSICLRVRNVISQIFHWAEFPLNFTLSANSLLIRLISKSCRDTQIELYFPHHVKVNLVNFWKFHQSTKITKYLHFLALLHGNKFLVKENCA